MKNRDFLVTDNQASMPAHLEAHWTAGGHIWGFLSLKSIILLLFNSVIPS
ncbi:MAG: hypothetical protein RMY27_23075 [Nostoc sp. DedQUE09]|nr:hypothetical protein [Nostoc sp. DedQUE09]